MDSRPKFWPFIREMLKFDRNRELQQTVSREAIRLVEPRRHVDFLSDVGQFLTSDQISFDEDDRLGHAYGRSFRDVQRLRAGKIDFAPDAVLLPAAHEQVEKIVSAAGKHKVILIPFGGGTNIVGALEPKHADGRMVVSLDLRRMQRLLKLDEHSQIASFEAGVFGPELERLLEERGFALGHEPDSFEFSTLGGWIATRSCGTQSNIYGGIEDMVVSLRVVTPLGTIETKPAPAASNGPDLNRLMCGSEGMFGVITQASLRVHRTPECLDYRIVLFKNFAAGYEALYDCLLHDALPDVVRYSDEMETRLIFAAKHGSHGLKAWFDKPIKAYLKWAGFSAPCVLLVGFEGPAARTLRLRNAALRILKRHGGFDTGQGPGRQWRKSRFDVPWLRDYMMDYGVIGDSMETAAVWSNVRPLYESVRAELSDAIQSVTGYAGYVGCHLSHLYKTGACIYFTIAARGRENDGPLELLGYYEKIKARGTEAIMRGGGVLSHHHAVGYEHRPWLPRELSPAALAALRAVKSRLDPENIMNPTAFLVEEAEADLRSR
jgi:alkyldihydroxyacetonephosphate synthase